MPVVPFILQPPKTQDRNEQSARKMLYLETRIFAAEDGSEGTVGHFCSVVPELFRTNDGACEQCQMML